MLKSTFIMFLEVYCQNKTISANNNKPCSYNLHDLGFAGILWDFGGETISFHQVHFRKACPRNDTYREGAPGWKQWLCSPTGMVHLKAQARRLALTTESL